MPAKPSRVTIDMTPKFKARFDALVELVDAGTGTAVIRQALQVYEYLAQKSAAGATFQMTTDGVEREVVFVGVNLPQEEEK